MYVHYIYIVFVKSLANAHHCLVLVAYGEVNLGKEDLLLHSTA